MVTTSLSLAPETAIDRQQLATYREIMESAHLKAK